MFNFPNSPSQGQTFTPAGGYQYVFTGGVWRIVESPQSVLTAEARNRVVNPCFQIQQDTTMASGYVADQWWCSTTIPTTGYSRSADAPPSGSKYNIGVTISTPMPSLAAGDFLGFGTTIEGIRIADFKWGGAGARQVVLRFALWSTVAGTFNISLMNGPTPTRSYVDTFTISAAEVATYAYKTFVIPGDVVGPWNTDNTAGIIFYVTFATGSLYSTATRGWQAGEKYGLTTSTNGVATAAGFYLYDVGLYLDPLNTGVAPTWTMPDEAQELIACQRYFQKFYTLVETPSLWQGFAYPVEFRVAPAIAGGGAGFNLFIAIPQYFVGNQTARAVPLLSYNARM